jgi:hypothetical protein
MSLVAPEVSEAAASIFEMISAVEARCEGLKAFGNKGIEMAMFGLEAET